MGSIAIGNLRFHLRGSEYYDRSHPVYYTIDPRFTVRLGGKEICTIIFFINRLFVVSDRGDLSTNLVNRF